MPLRPRLASSTSPVKDESAAQGTAAFGDGALSDLLFDDDIPPAIACAVCGRPGCEGCEKVLSVETASTLPWEDAAAQAPLLKSALFTVEHPDLAFGGVHPLSLGRALAFACLAELLAVSSFAVPWALGFLAVFSRLAMQMAKSPVVWLVAAIILASLVLLVVAIHLVWGIVLEWAIGRQTVPARYDQGVRFGLYACGWDLVTSPYCFFALLFTKGPGAAFTSLKRAAAAPRSSFNLYLERARGLDEAQARSAGRLSVIVTTLIFLLGVCLGFAALLWYLLFSNVYFP